MKIWRTVLLGGVLLPLFAGCSGEGVSPSRQPLGPADSGPMMENGNLINGAVTMVEYNVDVDKIEYFADTDLLNITINLNRGLFTALRERLVVIAIVEISNATGQTRTLQITQSLALTKPLGPPKEGLVVIAIVGPWDQKDSNGNLIELDDAVMVEYDIQLQFTDGGSNHTLAHTLARTTGSMLMEEEG